MPRSPDHLVKRCGCGKAAWPTCPHGYHLRYSYGGREWRLSLDKERETPGGPMTVKEAITLRNKVIAEIEAGKRTTRPEDFTFAEVCQAYTAKYVNVATRRPRARVHFEQALNRLQQATVTVAGGRRVKLATVPIRSVTRVMIEEIRTAHRARHAAIAEAWQAAQRLAPDQRPADLPRPTAKGGEVAVNRLFARLRHLLNWAVLAGYLDATPFKLGGVTAVKLNHAAETARDRRLAPDEEAALLQAATPHLRSIITAILETGCRPGEILNLRWQDVDLDAGLLSLRGERTKTSRPRAIPVTARLRAVLTMLQTDSDGHARTPAAYVFGDEIGQKVASVKTAWQTACRKAGIEGLHLHDLRREFASRLLESSVELHVTRTWLGHASIATTSRYLAVTITGLQAAAKRFEAARDGANKDSSGRSRTESRWSRRSDSNRRPADYESAALPTELRRPAGGEACVVPLARASGGFAVRWHERRVYHTRHATMTPWTSSVHSMRSRPSSPGRSIASPSPEASPSPRTDIPV
jgi:integrase